MKITFLSADRPLTKTYVFSADSVESTPYPLTHEFTSHIENVSSLEDLYVALSAHASVGHCLLKGNLQRPIVRESRAGLTVAEATELLVLDFDGVDLKGKTIDELLTEIGVGDTSYILQYSASYGIKPGYNAHVFMMLTSAVAAEVLKLWFKWRNLTTPLLRNQLSLTKTGMSLHWPLDITVGQNDKLLYISPPTIVGKEDPLKERITLNKRSKERATISPAPSGLDDQAAELIRQLRSASGLKDHKLSTVYSRTDQVEVLKNPDVAAVTGVKRSGDFVYINLNSGDSWGYYHTAIKPEILHNFKGEPLYKLREIAPEYYKEAKLYARKLRVDAHRPKELNGKPQRWIINRKDEGKYYKVTYIPNEGITLDPCPTLKHAEDWCISNNLLIPEAIEDWVVEFDPTSTEIVKVKDKRINIYKPTIYKAKTVADEDCPEEYLKLIHHVCGSDEEAASRFINWLAYIWQTGKKPKTAWALHGNYGTGKGRLAKVLGALFGDQFVSTSPEAISEFFNAAVERAQILWIDEVTTDAWDNSKITPKLRNWITEDDIALRAMRKDMKNVRNYMGIIIAANEHNPVEVKLGDRRWNFAPRQEVPLLEAGWATDEILDDAYGSLYQPDNLQAFADFLTAQQVDVSLVRRPLMNQAKQAVMSVTQNLPEDIVQALQAGNTSFFVEYVLPSGSIPTMESALYKSIVEKMMQGGRVALRTEDIRNIFLFLANWNQKAAKFNKAAARFGLYLSGKIVRDGKDTYAGIAVDFTVTDEDRILWSQLNGDQTLKVVREAEQC